MDRDNRLPLFPLRTVLFPGGRLPLQIFEVRYLDMIGRAHRDGTPFGVVCLTEGEEVRAADPAAFGSEAFHQVGTLARVDHLERPRPGLLRVHCTGTRRFRLERSECLPHGLWVGEVSLLVDDAQVTIPADLEHVAIALERVAADLREQGAPEDELPMQPPWQFDACGWVANRWCELLPLPMAVKQRLLELESPLLRLELVADALDELRGTGGG